MEITAITANTTWSEYKEATKKEERVPYDTFKIKQQEAYKKESDAAYRKKKNAYKLASKKRDAERREEAKFRARNIRVNLYNNYITLVDHIAYTKYLKIKQYETTTYNDETEKHNYFFSLEALEVLKSMFDNVQINDNRVAEEIAEEVEIRTFIDSETSTKTVEDIHEINEINVRIQRVSIENSLTAENFRNRKIDERLVEATKDDINHTTLYETINDYLEDEEHDNDEDRDASIEEHLKCFYDEYQNTSEPW